MLILNNKGQVVEGWFTYIGTDYKIYYDGKEAVASTSNDYLDSSNTPHNTIPEPGSSVVAVKTYNVGEAVYLDPTDLSATCNQENSVSTTGTKTGCMKFYVTKDNGDSVNLLLDHNTINVKYDTSGTYKEYEQASIKTQVDSDTQGWSGNPRLITANEIAEITSNTEWDSTKTGQKFFYFGSKSNTNYENMTDEQKAIQRSFAWLFDYTKDYNLKGCNIEDSSVNGYWTSSPNISYSNRAWVVHRFGVLDSADVDNDTNFGIRPVITINKSDLN